MREKMVIRRRLQETKYQTQHGKVMREKETAPFINDVASRGSLKKSSRKVIWVLGHIRCAYRLGFVVE
jgi:hypothetical protein